MYGSQYGRAEAEIDLHPRTHVPRCVVVLQPVLQTFDGRDDVEIQVVNLEPLSVTVRREDATRADTAEVQIAWRQLPLDPRALVGCRVEILMADAEDPAVAFDFTNRDHLVFIGVVDEHAVDLLAPHAPVNLSCRDYSGILLDAKWDGSAIPSDGTLADSILHVLGRLPSLREVVPNVARNASVKSHTGKATWLPPRSASLWECIYGLAQSTGQVAWWELGDLYIGPPKNAEDTPPRVFGIGDRIDSLSIRRAASPLWRSRVVIRALNTATSEVVEGRWPDDASEREDRVFALTGEYSPAQLRDRARMMFETFARRHIEGTFKTIAMVDDVGRPLVGAETSSDADSLAGVQSATPTPPEKANTTLKGGDAVMIRTAWTNQQLLGTTSQDTVDFLVQHGMPEADADRIVDAWAKSDEVGNLFVVRTATHDWSPESGYSLTVDFYNLVGL